MDNLFYGLTELNPMAAFPIALIGCLLGLYGWRLVHHLAVADAILVAVLAGLLLGDPHITGLEAAYVWPLNLLLLLGLPWLAWRYPRWSTYGISGLVGFVTPYLVGTSLNMESIVCLLMGGIGCAAAIAFQVTLFRQTSVVISGLHGGFLWVMALSALSTHPGSVTARFMNAMGGYEGAVPVLLAAFSAILISFQWADMQRHLNPH